MRTIANRIAEQIMAADQSDTYSDTFIYFKPFRPHKSYVTISKKNLLIQGQPLHKQTENNFESWI